MEVVLGIERQLGRAVVGLDEDGLEGVPEHRVLVGDEENRPVGGDDALKLAAAAEGTFKAVVDDGHRFGAADFGVENQVGLPGGHG